MASPKVVIVGGGFGGLACARKLDGKQVDVLLVDSRNYHLFTPLLYQVGTALLNPSEPGALRPRPGDPLASRDRPHDASSGRCDQRG
jgi:flavin-dependent dehydrogenase